MALDELHFNEPPDVIGQGGFGVVILGEYRGTEVAVKRVIPPETRKQGAKDSVVVGQKSGTMSGTASGTGSGLRSTAMKSSAGWKSGAVNSSGSGTKSGVMSNGSGSGGSGTRSGILNFGGNVKHTSTKAERRKLEREFISEMRYVCAYAYEPDSLAYCVALCILIPNFLFLCFI